MTARRMIVGILRAPAVLYDRRLGWLLGRRFLRLTHRGRRSGRCFQMMLEVIAERPAEHELFVMVGLGRRAQWYRNITAGGTVEVAIGRERFPPAFRELPTTEAAAILADYERRNRVLAPVVRVVLSRLVGWRYDGSPTGRERLVSERPVLAFRPCTSSPRSETVPRDPDGRAGADTLQASPEAIAHGRARAGAISAPQSSTSRMVPRLR